MFQLICFLPCRDVNTLADLEEAGFGSLIDRNDDGEDPQLSFFPDVDGPSLDVLTGERITQHGSFVVMAEADSIPPTNPPTVDLDRQVWVGDNMRWYGRGAGAIHFGWWREFPPTESLLQRRRRSISHGIVLKHAIWAMPSFMELPLQSPDGPFPITEADVLAHRLAREVERELWAQKERSPEPSAPVGSLALVEYALARNYRLCPELIDALGLFDEGPATLAAAAFVPTDIMGRILPIPQK